MVTRNSTSGSAGIKEKEKSKKMREGGKEHAASGWGCLLSSKNRFQILDGRITAGRKYQWYENNLSKNDGISRINPRTYAIFRGDV